MKQVNQQLATVSASGAGEIKSHEAEKRLSLRELERTHKESLLDEGNSLRRQQIVPREVWKSELDMAVKKVIVMMGIPPSSLYDTKDDKGALMKSLMMQDLLQAYGHLNADEIVEAFRLAITGKLTGLPKGWDAMYGSQISFRFFANVLNIYEWHRGTKLIDEEVQMNRKEQMRLPTEEEKWRNECRFYFEDLYPLVQDRRNGDELSIDEPEIGWAAIHLYMIDLGYIVRNVSRDRIVKGYARDTIDGMTGKEATNPKSDLYKVYLQHFKTSHYKMLCQKFSVQLWIDTHIFNAYGPDHMGMNSEHIKT